MESPLLLTKLFVPQVRASRVSRPSLVARLNQGLRGKLTLVSAQAGFGKTTLVSEWLQQVDRPFAWLSLDEGDNDPNRFLTYLAIALQRINSSWGQTVQELLRSPQPPAPTAMVAALINEIAAGNSPFVLILDDYQLISASSIHDALSFLLDKLPPPSRGMHLVILSRADPPLPLARLRARGELTEIRADDLRFTLEEALAFLNEVMGLGLTRQQIAVLESHTEGWAAGLQLAGLSLQGLPHGDVAGFIEAFAGSHRYVMDYLIEEVFNRQPPDVQQFLLQTSILDRLCGSLCDAVTHRTGSQEMLKQLEQRNLFTVPLDHHRRWYRYHHLFAGLLRDHLQKTQPRIVLELHRQASEWYERQSMLDEAIQHALTAQDGDRTVRLIEDSGGAAIRRGEFITLLRWLDALPAEVVRARPRLAIDYAWGLFLTGQAGSVGPYLEDTERALAQRAAYPPAPAEEQGTTSLRDEVAVLRLLSIGDDGDPDRAIVRSRQTLRQLDKNNAFVRGLVYLKLGIALRRNGNLAEAAQAMTEAVHVCRIAGNSMAAMIAIYNLTRLYGLLGQLYLAAEICRQALESAGRHAGTGLHCLPDLSLAYLGLADVHYEWNELDTAEQHVREAIALGEPGGSLGLLMNGYTLLARIRQARGDVQEAREIIRALEQVIHQRDVVQATADELATYRAWFALMQGNLGEAARWARTVHPGPEDKLDTLREFQWITLVRILIAQGRSSEAAPLLVRLLQTAESEGRLGKAIEILALYALALQAAGEMAKALAVLDRALTLAQPEGYMRTFVDEGAPMAALLSEILEAQRKGRHTLTQDVAPNYVRRLLAAFGEPAATSLMVEHLTERELEVLRLIAVGLKNQEIARILPGR
jgi:LuxR family maltose regulon positive regulatory protein